MTDQKKFIEMVFSIGKIVTVKLSVPIQSICNCDSTVILSIYYLLATTYCTFPVVNYVRPTAREDYN